MYFEKSHSFVNRHGWTFAHTGEQLAPLAQALHSQYTVSEAEARERAASLLRNASVHHEDKRVVSAKNDIVKFGKLREQCAVWAHEFARTPEREFKLGINDVAFFGIFPETWKTTTPDGASKRTDWKFTYKAKDLIEPFLAKCEALKAARAGILKSLQRKVLGDPEEEAEYEREMAENQLLAKEFVKNPDDDVILALGDIVYLELSPLLDLSGATTE